jgi:GntR family transcriptional regulator
MDIDYDSPERPSQQIAGWIRGRIEDGTLTPGRRLPSEAALQAETGSARTTIRRAVKLLRDEGRVTTVPGHGSFVAQSPSAG